MGLYDDLIPKGASGTATATPTPKAGGIYADLIPPPAAPTPPDNRGFLAKMVDNVTGKGTPTVPTPPPPAAPAISSSSIYKDLIPAPTPPVPAAPSLGSKIASTVAGIPAFPPASAAPFGVPPQTTKPFTLPGPKESTAPGVFVRTNPYPPTNDQQAESLAKGITGMIAGLPKALYDQQMNPDDIQKQFEAQTFYLKPGEKSGLGSIVPKTMNALGTVATRFFNPALREAGNIVSDLVISKNPEEYGMTAADITDLPTFKKTSLQIVGDISQAVLAAYAPTVFGEAASKLTSATVKSAILHGAGNGAQVGLMFGTSQALSSGSKDPAEIAHIIALNTIGASVLGAVTSGAIPIGKISLEAATKNIITEYHLPTTVKIDAAKVKSIFQTGKEISPQELDMVKSLGLDSYGYRKAFSQGLTIDVPAETIVKLVDKPYWAKIKGLFNVESVPTIIHRVQDGTLKRGPAGLLNAAGVSEPAPVELPGQEITVPISETSIYKDLIPLTDQNKKDFGTTATTIPINDQKLGQPNTATTKTKTPENGNAVIKPKTPEEAARRYYDEVLKPTIDAGEAPVIGADDLKDHFGGDYSNARHNEIYSPATFSLYERLLKESKDPEVAILGGGPASAKTELLVNHLKASGFKGVIYDSNSGSTPGLKKSLVAARAAGKDPRIYGITPHLERARVHTIKREAIKGRDVTDEAFANGHVGFPEATSAAIRDGDILPSKVHILDTRHVHDLQIARDNLEFGGFVADPLAHMESLGYNRDHVRSHYSKENVTRRNQQELRDAGVQTKNDTHPPRDRLPETAGKKDAVDGFVTKKERDAAIRDIKANSHSNEGDAVRKILAGKVDIKPNPKTEREWKDVLGKRYYKVFKKGASSTADDVAEQYGFDSEDALREAVAHEMFDRNEKVHGNASIGAFRDGTPLTIDTDKIKAIDLPEMVQLAKMLMGQVPKIREKVSRHFGGTASGVFIGSGKGEIRLRADLFDPKKSDIGQAAKTLAHEIGHLIDYLPEGTLSRGNILGRLLTLKNFGKEFLDAAGASRSANEIKEELWQLSKYWKPIDEETASKSFLEYRKSGKEVYADFISVLFNDPKLAMDRSPAAYNLFFENLDKKPLARDAYFEVQSMLTGEHADLVKARRQGVQQMFKDGDYKAIELQNEKMAEREARNKNLIFKLKFETVDKNQALIDRVNALEKKGVIINPDDNPIYTFEERNYLGGKIKAIMESDFNPVYQDLVKADIPWHTFGEALFYDRIVAGDRSSQANPRGLTVKAAEELQQTLRDELTTKQVDVLESAIKDFRGGLRKVAEEAYKEGLYTPELYKQMQENPAYVTFQVIDHLETAMSSKVFKSIGTFKDITNPADASILKMIATIKAIERNKVTRSAIDFLKEHFPEEIEDAKSVFNGKNGTRFIDSRQPNQELALMYRNGKAEGHYIDPYIKKSIDNESVGQSLAIVAGLKFANSHIFRPLFIGFNVGFQSFNFIRDFTRFYKNIPTMTLGRVMQRYIEAYPLARTRAFGPKYNGTQKWMQAAHDLNTLEKEQVFSVTFNDLIEGEAHDDTQIERILRTSGIDSFQPKQQHAALKPFVAILDFVKRVGDLIETLPKAAGFYEIADGKPLTMDEKSYIRKYIGSPDFLAGGHLKPATNEIFLFSNAIVQGIRADYDIATNPKTRGAYWYKTVKLNLLPKIIMYAAALGVFGAEIKKMMDDASEYDKTNYTVIPLGHDSTGKTVYFRMPQDETGRLLSGIAWKMLDAGNNKQPWTTDAAQIGSFAAGQLPSISPVITAASATFQFMSGQNPYDPFRGRTILSDDVFAAGGMRANEAFLGWMFNELGGGIITQFQVGQNVPQVTGTAEKIFNAPILGNIIGRFFRVSDYGTTEQLATIRKNVAGQEAEQRLENKDLINSYVKQYQADPNRAVNQRKYELALVKEKFGGTAPTSSEDVAKAKNLVSSFRLALVKGSSPAEIDALVSSTSNAQKAAVLAELKSKMEPDQYKTLLDKAVSEKVVSPEVAHKAK